MCSLFPSENLWWNQGPLPHPLTTTWGPSHEGRDQAPDNHCSSFPGMAPWDLKELAVLVSKTEGKMVDAPYTRAVSFRPQGKVMFP